jgi:hypothetical protein
LKLIDTDETVLIVTGSDLPAEMNDRPIAYALKAEIDRRAGDVPFRGAVVVSDRWYAENRIFHLCATIAVGGPGVNALAASLVEQLPALMQRDDRVFVQGEWDGDEKRISCWGIDRVATAQAVEAFLREGHCDRFLKAVWRRPAHPRIDLA